MTRHRIHTLTIIAAAVLGCSAPAAPKSDAPTPSPPARVDEPRDLPQIPGVSRDELLRRADMTDAIGDLGAALERDEAATFGGLWIDSGATFRVVVAFTRDGEATIRRHAAGTPFERDIELRTVERSLASLQKTQSDVIAKLRGLGLVFDAGIDVKTNRIVIDTTDRPAFDAALAKSGYTLPAEVVVDTIGEPIPAPTFPVDPDPAVVFPRLRAPSPSMMQALLQGTLTLKDGCLRVVAPGDPTGHLVLWQPGYYPHGRGDALEILDRTGKPVARVGDSIALGGGELPLAPELTGQLEQPVPKQCGGPYWLMGELVPPK